MCPTCEQVTIPEQGTLLKSIQKKRGTTEEPVSKSTKPAAEGLPILNDQYRNNNDDNNDDDNDDENDDDKHDDNNDDENDDDNNDANL